MELVVRNGVITVSPEDFEEISTSSWRIGQTGYVSRDRPHKVRSLHRVVATCMGLEIEGKDVDHIDGDRSNNCRANLRVCSRAQNIQNQRIKRNNTSGFKGVSWSKGMKKWEARIMAFGQLHYLGYYEAPEEAHTAYCEAALRLHGDFARTK